MSKGALSPLLIHLLPLVYVTDGDPGPRHLQLSSTPSDSPANHHRKEDRLLFVCLQSIFFSLLLSASVCSCEGLNELESKVNLLS